jgi:hypothetical protein
MRWARRYKWSPNENRCSFSTTLNRFLTVETILINVQAEVGDLKSRGDVTKIENDVEVFNILKTRSFWYETEDYKENYYEYHNL